MDILYTIISFIFGAVFGSFFNVVGLRVPKKESIVSPPSYCTACDRRLTALDLVPILSYIVLRGKCRSCGVGISPIYLVTELVTGLLFAVAYGRIGLEMELAVALLFISLLVIITVSDCAYMLIPDKILLFFIPLLVLGRVLSPLVPWWDSLLGAATGFGILLLIAVISKGGMGGGDIKLFFVIGLVLGLANTLLTLFVASVIGMIVGVILLKVRGQSRKTPIPFGPSIAVSAIFVYFYGVKLLAWYWDLF